MPVAIVTGGPGTIGARICEHLAREGYDVAIGYRQDHEGARAVADDVEDRSQQATTLAGDVTDAMVRRRIVQRTVDELGGLDLLVNNAGMRETEPFLEVPAGELERTLRLDVAAGFHLAQRAAEPMLDGDGGAIVNVAAAAGLRADPARAAFSIAKAGVLALTRSAAVELAPEVTVNAVAPGVVASADDTDRAPGEQTTVEEQTPAGRWTSAAEVADAVTYLAQAPATLTGEVLTLDGGLASQLYPAGDETDRAGDEELGPGIEQRIEGPPEEAVERHERDR